MSRPRFGYRRLMVLLMLAGWNVAAKAQTAQPRDMHADCQAATNE